jgi:TPP-dependent indolepyruvate ferredoxin oxidoreductase alpha subunit
MSIPCPAKKIIRFLSSHQEIKILEELDDVAENQIKAMAFDQQAAGEDRRQNATGGLDR